MRRDRESLTKEENKLEASHQSRSQQKPPMLSAGANVDDKKKSSGNTRRFHCPPLVRKDRLRFFVPAVSATQSTQKAIAQGVKSWTGASPEQVNGLSSTPNGGVKGHTPGGSVLVHSASKKVELSVYSSNSEGATAEKIVINLLVRERDYQPKQMTAVQSVLSQMPQVDRSVLKVITSPAVLERQPRRSSIPTQNTVMDGQSAKQNVTLFLDELKLSQSSASLNVEGEAMNWCHVLSCAIANQARESGGTRFNSQVKENLFAGSRVFNENMMQIQENVMVKLLKEKLVSKIEYKASYAAFEGSQILAKLSLLSRIHTHDGRVIEFPYEYDVHDNRKFSYEFATTMYAAIFGIIENNKLPAAAVVVKESPLVTSAAYSLPEDQTDEVRSRTVTNLF